MCSKQGFLQQSVMIMKQKYQSYTFFYKKEACFQTPSAAIFKALHIHI